MSAECVYQSEEELWEDLLYFSLVGASNHRQALERVGADHGAYGELLGRHQRACARAKVHIFNLAAREHMLPPLLVEMARAEGLL